MVIQAKDHDETPANSLKRIVGIKGVYRQGKCFYAKLSLGT